MNLDIEDRNICYGCIGETYLKAEVGKSGFIARCAYCGNDDIECYTMPQLADRIDQAFSEHYDRMSEDIPDDWPLEMIKEKASEWEPSGDPVIDAIQQAVEIDEEVASDIQQILEEKHYCHSSGEIGETCNYHRGSYYDRKPLDDNEWYEKWKEFEVSLKTKARFFNKESTNHLLLVFNDINLLKTYDQKPILRTIGPRTDFEEISRARVFQSDSELEKALANCIVGLGPPPSESSTAGRMNASGISIFYGASDTETALAEVRPPVGSHVLVGQFRITRPLKILDLNALTNNSVNGSIFDANYAPLLSRSAFLVRLSQRMMQPVMPNDERFEYLPTQVIADFLGSELGLDGIVFTSVQSEDGYNIALFHHASRVAHTENNDVKEVDVSTYDWVDGEQVPYYSLNVFIKKNEDKIDDNDWSSPVQHTDNTDSRNETLQLIFESLTVHYIKSVKINNVPYPVAYSERKTSSGISGRSYMRKGLRLKDL